MFPRQGRSLSGNQVQLLTAVSLWCVAAYKIASGRTDPGLGLGPVWLMVLRDQGGDRPEAAGELSGRRLALRRLVLPATWLLSILVAIGLAAYGLATGAPWNPVQLLELLLLIAATWTVTWLMAAQPRLPKTSPLGLDMADGATADWLALVARHTGYSVTINSPERRLVWVNESFTRLTGYTAEEAIGQKTSALLYFERTDPGTVARIRE